MRTESIKPQCKFRSAERKIDSSATTGTRGQPCARAFKLERGAAELERTEARKKWKAQGMSYDAEMEREAAERLLVARMIIPKYTTTVNFVQRCIRGESILLSVSTKGDHHRKRFGTMGVILLIWQRFLKMGR